jgi:NTE family protein
VPVFSRELGHVALCDSLRGIMMRRVEGERELEHRRIALVLGGGGMKGFAHIGVLRALEAAGIRPTCYAGTSIGALIAAAYVGGMSLDEMERRALGLRKRDLFRINHVGMLLERMRSPSIYLEEPLRALCTNSAPSVTFDQLPVPLLVNTVDVERGTQVVWGLPGLTNVRVDDAVYASCALPGFFPPGRVDARLCIDGGTIDNLPVAVAAQHADAVIAVDVGSSDLSHNTDATAQGFAATYMRAATVMMHALQVSPLTQWNGPPMFLIRPRLGHVGWLSFSHTPEVIAEGYRAACEALTQLQECLAAKGGVYPRAAYRLSVNRDLCTGCGFCAAIAPTVMGLDARGKAYAKTEVVDWSSADGDFVRHCPTQAITASRLTPASDQPIAQQEVA